jgi:ubiquinone/menaquinone biosynthesis C-methylase UbiE
MESPIGHDQNADQIAYWNGPGGQRWADRQQAQDILLKPIADTLIDRAKPKAGERIIDVGCGSGATSIAFAQQVGSSGHVFGIDISGPMLARARASAPRELPVDFALADATIYPFDPASFDLLASRFGVMFFAEPSRSFANMRKALRPSGRLAFACWREPRENPFFMAPLQAVYKHVPKLPQQGPEDPGPFSFASEARVHRILGEAGFTELPWSRIIWRSMSRSGAASRRRCRARWKSVRPAARWKANRRTFVRLRRIRSVRYCRPSPGARRCRFPHRSGS